MGRMTENMTEEVIEDWASANVSKCPVCGSASVELDEMDGHNTTMFAAYTCKACGSMYTEHYEYSCTYVQQDGRFNKEQ